MIKLSLRLTLFAAVVCCAISCQKEISPDTPGQEPSSNCRVAEMSNLNWTYDIEDSTMFSKFAYDDKKRLIAVLKPTGDTDSFRYYTDSIVNDTYITFDFGSGAETVHWKHKYRLNASGLANYSLTTLESVGGYQQDSIVYTYDAAGYLTAWQDFAYSPNHNGAMQFNYKDGNLVKLIVTSRGDPSLYNALDSIVFKYSNLDVPANYSLLAYWPAFEPAMEYPWAGKQNKKLPIQVLTYYRWGADTDDYSYVLGADGLPSIIRQHTKEIDYQRPGQIGEWDQAYYLKYNCN